MGCNSFIFTWLGSIFGYVVQFFYNIFNNYGVAIILFTILTRLLMFPLTIKQQKSSAAQARLQPKLAQLKEKYGNNQQAYNEAMQELYSKEGVSPTAGCLPMIIQFPLFFGMYEAIRRPLTCVLHINKEKIAELTSMYGLDSKSYYNEIDIINKIKSGIFTAVTSASDVVSSTSVTASDVVSASNIVSGSNIASAGVASASDAVTAMSVLGDNFASVQKMCNSFNFLGFDLLQTAAFWNSALILAFLVFACQVFSMVASNKISATPTTPGCSPNMMAIGMGAFSLFISFSVPAAFPLYWATSSLLAPLQTWVTKKYFGPVVMNAKAEAARNARLRIEEQKIIDEVNETKGRIYLKPGKERISDSSENNVTKNTQNKKNNSSGKKNKGGNGSKNDYMGKRK